MVELEVVPVVVWVICHEQFLLCFDMSVCTYERGVVMVHGNIVSVGSWGRVVIIVNPKEFIHHTEYMREGVICWWSAVDIDVSGVSSPQEHAVGALWLGADGACIDSNDGGLLYCFAGLNTFPTRGSGGLDNL
jgi:hypothetical protein